MTRWIWNTDFFSMKGKYANPKDLSGQEKSFKEAMLHTTGEGDLIIGDPTLFNIHDENNPFDRGHDLDEDFEDFFGFRGR